MPFGMKRAVRASRKLCEYLMIYTNERHPSLLHLTPIEISQISMCQMSVDKRFILICLPIRWIDNAKLRNNLQPNKYKWVS